MVKAQTEASEMTVPSPRIDSPHVREEYLPVPGAELYIREVGSGSPILILHGGPDFNHNYLLPEMDRLASAFRLIYYDQRGRGKSSGAVAPKDVGIESEVDDLDRVRRHLGLSTVSLLGHSWGGLLAMEYGTRHPDRISGLILMNTAPGSYRDWMCFRQQRQATEAGNLAKMRAIAATREYAEGDIEAESEYYRIHFSRAVLRRDHLADVVSRLRSHFTPETVLKARAIENRLNVQTSQSPEYDLLTKLRRLKTPTLVIHGDQDFVPLECSTNIAEAVPGGRLVVLSDCGHFAYLERPAEVLSAITEHLT